MTIWPSRVLVLAFRGVVFGVWGATAVEGAKYEVVLTHRTVRRSSRRLFMAFSKSTYRLASLASSSLLLCTRLVLCFVSLPLHRTTGMPIVE